MARTVYPTSTRCDTLRGSGVSPSVGYDQPGENASTAPITNAAPR